jgi:hypothetical protein
MNTTPTYDITPPQPWRTELIEGRIHALALYRGTTYRGTVRILDNGQPAATTTLLTCRPMIPEDEHITGHTYDIELYTWLFANTTQLTGAKTT